MKKIILFLWCCCFWLGVVAFGVVAFGISLSLKLAGLKK